MLQELLAFIIAMKWPFVTIAVLSLFRIPIIKLMERIKAVRVKTPVGLETSLEAYSDLARNLPGTNENGMELQAEPLSATGEIPPEIIDDEAGDWVGLINQALENNQVSEAKEIFRTSIESTETSSSKSWLEGWFLSRLFTQANEASALSDLKDQLLQSTDYSIRRDYLWWVIFSLEEIKDHSQMVDILNEELLLREDNLYTDFVTVKLSQVLVKTNDEEKALTLLTDRLNEILKDDERSYIYRAIADVEKAQKNEKMQALCLEKNAQFNPTNPSILFQTAFTQAEAGLDIIAFANYDTVSTLSPNDNSTLNNLAVIYSEFSLPINSVELYKKASEAGNTLSMANLAYQMIGAGLISEAEEILKQAIGTDEPHKSVFEAMSTIPTKRAKEEEEVEKVREKSIRYREHLRNYTEAYYLRPGENVFEGLWIDQYDRTFRISPDHNKIEVEWESNSSSNMDVICKLSGSIVNSSGILNYSTKPAHQGEALSYYMQLLNKSYQCYAYLSSNRNKINLISLNSSTDFFLTISRVKK